MLSLAERPIAPEDEKILKSSFQRVIIPESTQYGKCANCAHWIGKIWRGMGVYKDVEGQKKNISLLLLHSRACEIFINKQCKKFESIQKNEKVLLLSGCYAGTIGLVKDIEIRPSGKKSLYVKIQVIVNGEMKIIYPWILADNVLKEVADADSN